MSALGEPWTRPISSSEPLSADTMLPNIVQNNNYMIV